MLLPRAGKTEISALPIQICTKLTGNKKFKPFLSRFLIILPIPGMKTREPSWTYIAPDDVVGVIHYISGKAKVTYFHHFPVGHQYVPGSKVSMNALRRKGRINAPQHWYQRWTIPCSLSWHLLPLPSWTLPGCWWQGDRARAGTNVPCSCFLLRVLPKTATQSSLLSQGRRYSSSLPLSGSVLQPAFYKVTYF